MRSLRTTLLNTEKSSNNKVKRSCRYPKKWWLELFRYKSLVWDCKEDKTGKSFYIGRKKTYAVCCYFSWSLKLIRAIIVSLMLENLWAFIFKRTIVSILNCKYNCFNMNFSKYWFNISLLETHRNHNV